MMCFKSTLENTQLEETFRELDNPFIKQIRIQERYSFQKLSELKPIFNLYETLPGIY